MKLSHNIFVAVSAIFLMGMLAMSCEDKEDIPDNDVNIAVNTQSISESRAGEESAVESFTVLFWKEKAHLETPDNVTPWSPILYLAAQAGQSVDFYRQTVFDTRYPYPDRTSYLYATGFAPTGLLKPDNFWIYRRLIAQFGEQDKARYDFLGCDVWSDVYRGSQDDPFAQEKNKLYFRHLTAKLLFYADRDKVTMENKQFVRNVKVTRLYMSTDGGKTYTSMYTPSVFEWQRLETSDFTSAYTKVLNEVKSLNSGVTSVPRAGYKAKEVVAFAGDDPGFVLERHASDHVPINGLSIDSCYVSNNIIDGVVQSSPTHPIRLKMDISAELSFDRNFPVPDDSGSTTDDMTFTRTWEGVELSAIYEVDADGKVTETAIHEFKPGMEYCIYIHFHRSGVNLVAIEQPWEVGGVHYLSISGADK